jgi:hypothetical protein
MVTQRGYSRRSVAHIAADLHSGEALDISADACGSGSYARLASAGSAVRRADRWRCAWRFMGRRTRRAMATSHCRRMRPAEAGQQPVVAKGAA